MLLRGLRPMVVCSLVVPETTSAKVSLSLRTASVSRPLASSGMRMRASLALGSAASAAACPRATLKVMLAISYSSSGRWYGRFTVGVRHGAPVLGVEDHVGALEDQRRNDQQEQGPQRAEHRRGR